MLTPRVAPIIAALCFLSPSAIAGQICIVDHNSSFTLASNECNEAGGAIVEITPAPRARRFLYISDAGQDFVVGLVAAGEKKIDLTKHAAALYISMATPPDHDWPRPGTFVLTEKSMGTWKWPMTAEQVGQPATILLPPGIYDFETVVEGHKLKKMQGLEIKPRHERAERVQLEPLQRLIARVVGTDGTAVPFPQVFAECRDPICEGDATGQVKCEIPEGVESLCIERNAIGRRRIVLDPTLRDITIPKLELFRGATFVVRITDDQQFPEKTKASLIKYSGGRTRTLTERALDGRLLLFEDLEPAKYALLVSGPEPLQRLAFPFTIEEADFESQLDVSMQPFRLTGLVTHGGNPLPQASVEFNGDLWRSRLRTDEEGNFSAQAWGACNCGVIVTAAGLSTPYGTMKQISDTGHDIRIDIPTRRIVGRVVDASENIGVAGARVDVQMVTGEVHQSRAVTADANGDFEFSGAEAGSYVLRAISGRHLPADPVRVELPASEDTRRVDLRLISGVATDAMVLDSARRPAGGALVFIVRPDNRFQVFTTGADGRVSLPLQRRSAETVFVLTKDGSLGLFATVAAEQANQEAIPLVLPPGVATIVVKARSESGKALGGMWLNARLNGREIPAAVLKRFAEAQNVAPVTNGSGEILLSRLPVGIYEIALVKAGPQGGQRQWARVELGTGTTVVEQTFTE